jgi:23S rRNA pseudouridine2605 synthase
VVYWELRVNAVWQKTIEAILSSTQEFDETQLEAARATAWKQMGEPVLTLEAARDWINERGIVLFAPRAAQLPAPAPSLVEATMGVAKAAPSFAETEVARSLVARLVGEGLALPLNLLGVPGDSPDFVVSAQVFSFVFTMRGDKAWKLPPSTTGAVKVSPLGLKVYEVVTERGPVSAAEVAQELGREVTEAAILRSLTELWSQLRVIPLLSQGEGGTLWELTSRRFTKAIKAGANAGQPTALSGLISLYLAQVFAATEEEVTTFLSPLTARSRVREVLHALVGARQLETVVLEGKTLLHIPGGLPAAVSGVADETVEGEEAAAVAEKPKKIGTGRIKSFASEGKVASEFRGKPVAKSFGKPAGRGGFAAKRPGAGPVKPSARFGARLDGKTDPERRPFKKDGAAGPKKTFTKPWEEDKKPRAAGAGKPFAAAKADGFTKFRRPAAEHRAPLGAREQAGLPVERRTPPRSATKSFEKRPYAPRTEEGGERATFKPRSYESRDRVAKPGGFGAKRPYVKRDAEGGAKPFAKRPYAPRGEGAEKRPYTPRTTEGGAKPFAKRPYTPRGEGAQGSFTKRPYTPRTEEDGERASFKPRSFAARESSGTFPKRPYKAREGGTRPFMKKAFTPRVEASGGAESTVERSLPKRPYKPRAADAHTRPFTKEPWVPKAEGDGAKRTFKPKSAGNYGRSGAGAKKGFGGKPAGKFGGKPGGFGAKRSGPAGAKPAFRRKPEA